MRKLTFILLLILVSTTVAHAQGITHSYHNEPLPKVLKDLNHRQHDYIINFVYDDLEDFRVTADLHQAGLQDALRQLIGFYPIKVSAQADGVLLVECQQKTPHRVTGRVVDSFGQPVQYANIALLGGADSTFVAGGVTTVDGNFVIPCTDRRLLLRVSYVGFKTLWRHISQADVGTLRLQPDSQVLKSVVVKGHRLPYTSTPRGLKVSVEGTPLAEMGTASDMISHLPLMMADGSVAGHGKPEIYINNKKVRNSDELNRLQANEVRSAEVITLPGAEYGADVRSVIRLKTIRKQGEGWSGNFSTYYNQRKNHSLLANASLNYRLRDGMDFFVRGSFTDATSLTDIHSHDRLQASSLWNYDSQTKWKEQQMYGSIDVGWNWEINEHHSVGLTYTFDDNIGDSKKRIIKNEDVSRDGTFLERDSSYSMTREKPRPSHAVNAYYVGDIGKWNIDFSADLYNEHEREDMDGGVKGEPGVSSNTKEKSLLLAEKLVVTAPVPKGDLTFGEEVSHIHHTSRFRQSGFSADNNVSQRTNIWSLFADYSISLGQFDIAAGLRWQNEYNRYNEDGQRDDDMSPDYHVWVPSASVSYHHGAWRHTLAYSAVRTNPPYGLFNNTVNYISKYEYRTGNPFLKPTKVHDFTWTSHYKWLYVQLYYYHSQYIYTTFQSAYDDEGHPGVVLMDYRNVPHANNYGLTINCSPTIGPWHMNYTAIFGFSDIDYKAIGIPYSWNRLRMDFNLDNTFTLPHNWTINLRCAIQPYRKTGCSIDKTSWQTDVRIWKRLLKNKSLRIGLLADDIFKTQYRKCTAYGGLGFRTQFKEYDDARRIAIGLQWQFNTTSSRYKGSHAGQDERERL